MDAPSCAIKVSPKQVKCRELHGIVFIDFRDSGKLCQLLQNGFRLGWLVCNPVSRCQQVKIMPIVPILCAGLWVGFKGGLFQLICFFKLRNRALDLT